MKVIKPPDKIDLYGYRGSVFLAGSIEMGAAVDWQARVTEELADMDVVVLNPRRDDWDSSWEQSIDNPQFYEQVTWKLEGLERADRIIMYFAPDTKSPISLLELGMHIGPRMYVCCPRKFWRRGNVEIVCDRYGGGIPLFANLDALLVMFRRNNPWMFDKED
jgi:hypothetical protein